MAGKVKHGFYNHYDSYRSFPHSIPPISQNWSQICVIERCLGLSLLG